MALLFLNVEKTLLHSYSLFYPLASLKPDDALLLSPQTILLSDPAEWRSYTSRLHRAYHAFVTLIAHAETTEEPLGLFRPGIFEVMNHLQSLYQRGHLSEVVLYSSYPFSPLSLFARDVFRLALFLGLSSSSSSLSSYQPLPMEVIPVSTLPAFVMEKGDASLYVVDDHTPPSALSHAIHLSLPPYTYRTPFKRVGEVYRQALHLGNVPLAMVHEVNLFLFSSASPASPASSASSPSSDTLCSFLEQRTGNTSPLSEPAPKANGILSLLHLVERIERERA